jgi:ribosomal protein S18 acetylase RimI-like enzyme
MLVVRDAAATADAAALVFEYVARTEAEKTGQPAPTRPDQLPTGLRRLCANLASVHAPPGALLVAYLGAEPAGCVGLVAQAEPGVAEIKRLYVRPAFRGSGVGGALMAHAHRHAARNAFTTLVLDVLPSRTAAIGFYQRLGYVNAEPGPLVRLRRPVLPRDNTN